LPAGVGQGVLDPGEELVGASRHGPAKLLNLGRASARTGRTEEAATLFKAALESRENIELVLADGRVINSKDAAKMACAGL